MELIIRAIKKTAIKWSEYIKNEIIETSCLSAYAKYLKKAIETIRDNHNYIQHSRFVFTQLLY